MLFWYDPKTGMVPREWITIPLNQAFKDNGTLASGKGGDKT